MCARALQMTTRGSASIMADDIKEENVKKTTEETLDGSSSDEDEGQVEPVAVEAAVKSFKELVSSTREETLLAVSLPVSHSVLTSHVNSVL